MDGHLDGQMQSHEETQFAQVHQEPKEKKNRKMAILWLISPILALVGILVLYTFPRYILGFFPGAAPAILIINVLLSLLAILVIFLVPVGLVMFVVTLTKK